MPWAGVRQAVVDGVSSGLSAIFILLAVGALIGTWALGGTIVAMIYYGLDLLRADFFYASTLIICALIAVAVGSSWTVIGTIGVGLMGVAANLGLSPEIAAGAIVSGAFFGDRTSPLSDTVNLNAAVTGADLFTLIRESLWTSIPSFVIALALFAFVGHSAVADQSHEMSELASHFNVSVWAFAPLALVFALALMRVSPFVTVFSGALLGGVVAILINPAQVIAFAGDPSLPIPLAMLKGVWTALATGYVSNSGDPRPTRCFRAAAWRTCCRPCGSSWRRSPSARSSNMRGCSSGLSTRSPRGSSRSRRSSPRLSSPPSPRM